MAGMGIAFACIGAGYFRTFWLGFDMMSHLTLHYAIAAIAFGGAYLVPRHRILTAVSLMAAGVALIGLWPLTGDRQLGVSTRPVPNGMRELKVVHFNSWLSNDRAARVAAEIARLDGDIVLVTEFGPEKGSIIDELSSRYPYRVPQSPDGGMHLVLLSKIPFADTRTMKQWEGPAFVQADLGPDWGGLTIVGTHTIRPPHYRAHYRQMKALAAHIAKLRAPRIVLGDMNSTPFSATLAALASSTNLLRITSLPTWPANGPQLPQLAIDHIFIEPDITLAEPVITGYAAGSDHLPVAARLFVPGNARMIDASLGTGQ